MKSEKITCKHSNSEEKYICLEESCLEKQDYKLDCFKCLLAIHPHHECLIHVQKIMEDAQQTQKTFLDLFEENQKFCSTLKQKLELNVGEIKQRYSEWIDMQYKLSLEQIEQYELGIKEQKEKFQQTQLTSDQLKTAIQYSLFNNELYMQENLEIQEILEQNQLEFIQYFKFLYERCFKDYEHKITQNNQLPKVQAHKGISKAIAYQKCDEIGCKNKEKKYFCLDQNCLSEYSVLECPTCQGIRHTQKDILSHRQYFISADDLWEQQNKRIDELGQFCDNQGQNIKKESQELQETIMNFILNNEQKLKKIKQFCQNKENEMKDKLIKFKSMYQKDEYIIYKELFLQKDISIIAADIQQFSENFKSISNSFKKQCQTEKDHYQQDLKDLEAQWSKGLCSLKPEKQDTNDINSVSLYIEKMNEQVLSLTQQNKQYQVQMEQLNQDYQNVKDLQETLNTKVKEEINSICTGLNKDIQQQLQSQNKELQQQILEFMKEDRENLKQNMNQIQQADTNLDNTIKQQLEISGKLDQGIQQLNVKLTNCINNETSKITNLIQNIPLAISQKHFYLLSDEFKEVIKRKFQSHSKQVKQFQLQYLGKRDGLNYSAYYNKVSGKSSLIIVFRSINDGQYVFGGYYHGQWNFTGSYLPDDTGISFIFSQTHNQIYPIKVKSQAQLLYSSYIVYMGSPDLYIAADFVSGSSNLGQHYSTEQYKIQTNHLYGGPTPNVIECEVYQIIFQ